MTRGTDQSRWDGYGEAEIEALRERPDEFVITENPHRGLVYGAFLEDLLQPISGRAVLEIGVGAGKFSCFLAKQGAMVSGIDIGPNLVEAARLMADANGVSCTFQEASAAALPFSDSSFDLVVGIAVLHHLSDSDLAATLRETHRVLRRGGLAVFCEPIKNSRLFELLLQLVPAGAGRYYRPALWQRQLRREFQARSDERTLSSELLLAVGRDFKKVHLHPFGFLSRLERLTHRPNAALRRIDELLLARVPPLRRLSRFVVADYQK